jgi:hypothetical protein
MRLSSLCVSAVLLFSVATFAQHSSGGGGGGSSSSGSSGGGGSHGGGGGSSSSGGSGGGHSSGSSGAHSSGGSSPHASSEHGSSGNGSSGNGSSAHSSSGHGSITTPISTHPSVNNSRPVNNSHTNNSHSNNEHSVHEPNPGAQRTEIPEKRGFFGFLRHPFRRPEPNPPPKTKPVADLRRPVPCLKGPCAVCPPGQAHAGGCGATFYIRHEHHRCTSGEIWTGGSCLLQTQFFDSCNALRSTLQRQEQRMRAAESQQQNACAASSSQACMDSTNAAQSEAALYRSLQQQYQRCMQRSGASQPVAGFGLRGYAPERLFEPFDLQFNYP